ncbi:hypothetical protein EON63_08345 [archaeon]|nr:MAG: hypothetical protein EON63_08345 [archaeon]
MSKSIPYLPIPIFIHHTHLKPISKPIHHDTCICSLSKGFCLMSSLAIANISFTYALVVGLLFCAGSFFQCCTFARAGGPEVVRDVRVSRRWASRMSCRPKSVRTTFWIWYGEGIIWP